MSVLISGREIIQALRQRHHSWNILAIFSLSLLGGRFVSNITLWRLNHDIMSTARICPRSRPVRSVDIVDVVMLIISLASRDHYVYSW